MNTSDPALMEAMYVHAFTLPPHALQMMLYPVHQSHYKPSGVFFSSVQKTMANGRAICLLFSFHKFQLLH